VKDKLIALIVCISAIAATAWMINLPVRVFGQSCDRYEAESEISIKFSTEPSGQIWAFHYGVVSAGAFGETIDSATANLIENYKEKIASERLACLTRQERTVKVE
jgi:hypothetical protein